jgi:hypothetical protein
MMSALGAPLAKLIGSRLGIEGRIKECALAAVSAEATGG